MRAMKGVRTLDRVRAALVGVGLAVGLGAIAAPAMAQAPPTLRAGQTAALGRFVTDAQGRTLYEFRRDTGPTSACVDACLTTWPPLVQAAGQPTLAPGLGGTIAVATQADGRRQVLYNGKLLYYYRSDAAPGDTTGQGVGGNWFVVEIVAGANLPSAGGAAGMPVAGSWALPLAGLGVAAGAVLRRRWR